MFSHEDNGPEPDWVLSEREQFNDFRDLNKDGKLDKDEIRHWILPQDYDHAQAEARHLVYESDKNKVASTLRAIDWQEAVCSRLGLFALLAITLAPFGCVPAPSGRNLNITYACTVTATVRNLGFILPGLCTKITKSWMSSRVGC